MLQYLESQIGIASHPSRRPRSLSSGAHSRDPLVTSSQDEVGDISAAGWANRDRGEPHDSSPPTPPYIRVRIRRFDRLSWLGTATVARPSDLSEAFDRAMASAGLLLSRQGPRGLPAACAA